MQVNVEYATPFKWAGSAIYAKLISFGNLASSGFKWIGISGAAKILFAFGRDSTGQLIPTNGLDMTAGAYYTVNVTGSYNVGILASGDRSAYSAHALVFYTKT